MIKLALLVYVSYPGFVCLPPVVLDASVRSPYEGPFTMTFDEAQRLKADDARGPLWLEIVGEDDPRFDDIKRRCPAIFFDTKNPPLGPDPYMRHK
jgi:hypothetical protein